MSTVFYAGTVPEIADSTIDRIEFAGDRFVNLRGAKLSYSMDGASWTTIDSPGKTLSSIAYGNGIFVGVCKNGETYYSSNFTSWTQGGELSVGDANEIFVRFANGVFITAYTRDVQGTAYVTSSADGTSWSSQTSLPNAVVSGQHTIIEDMFVSGNYVYALLNLSKLQGGSYDTGILRYSSIGNSWSPLGRTQSNVLDYKIVAAAVNKNNSIAVFGGIPYKSSLSYFYLFDASKNEQVYLSPRNICSIIYDGTQFLALDKTGLELLQSTNGKEWGSIVLPKRFQTRKLCMGAANT